MITFFAWKTISQNPYKAVDQLQTSACSDTLQGEPFLGPNCQTEQNWFSPSHQAFGLSTLQVAGSSLSAAPFQQLQFLWHQCYQRRVVPYWRDGVKHSLLQPTRADSSFQNIILGVPRWCSGTGPGAKRSYIQSGLRYLLV